MARSSSLVLALSVCLPFVSGCGQAASDAGEVIRFDPCQPLVVLPDADATALQAAGVTAALALWNGSARSQLSLGIAGGPTAAPILPVHFQQAAALSHGFYDEHRGDVFINLDLVNRAQAVTIAHEIGHAFGLVHVSAGQRRSVMNPGNLDVTPTEGDVEALAQRWGRCPDATAQP